MSIVDSECGGPYLAIFQNKAEASGDRLERTEGVCRISYPTEQQFDPSRRGGPPVRFALICGGARSGLLVGTDVFRCVVRDHI